SPRTCTARTIPQVSSSRMEVLTLERATLRVSAISSAGTGLGERYRSAWIWATVRLMPHLVPISPQWRMYCFCNPVSSAISVLSVQTEYTESGSECQPDFRFAQLRREVGPPDTTSGVQ